MNPPVTGVHVILNRKRMRREFGQQNPAKKLNVIYRPILSMKQRNINVGYAA